MYIYAILYRKLTKYLIIIILFVFFSGQNSKAILKIGYQDKLSYFKL